MLNQRKTQTQNIDFLCNHIITLYLCSNSKHFFPNKFKKYLAFIINM